MKKLFRIALLLLITLLLTAGLAAYLGYRYLNPQPPARQAFVNGHVLTMDKKGTVAEAVYIEGSRIVAVGTTEEIRAQAGDSAKIIDLQGKTLMPGIIDAHGHFPGSGLRAVASDLNCPPIGDIKTIPEALERLRAQAENTPKGQMMYGYGYDDTLLAEQRHFTRAELDSVSVDHPIFVAHISGHMGVANSMALADAGIDKNTPDPVGGVIAKDETGELTGYLEETAMESVSTRALRFGTVNGLRMTLQGIDDYLAQGVTTAQNGQFSEDMLNSFKPIILLGLIPLRLVVWPTPDVADKIISGELDVESLENDRFEIGAVKLITDGSIQGYTGYLGKPYHVIPEGKPDDYRGYPTIPEDELNRLVEKYHRAGMQLAMHANGDAAIDAVIEAFAKAQEVAYREDARPIVIHAQMTRDDQLDRFAELGMTPSFFNSHVYYWGDRHKAIFMGPKRAKRMSPMRGALKRNVPFTIHLDTPVVPMTPWLAAWSAVTRQTHGGDILGKDQSISAEQALRAQTIDAAWQIFQEDNRGSIEPGKYADLIVLDRNPLENLENLRDPGVVQTMIGGVTRYAK